MSAAQVARRMLASFGVSTSKERERTFWWSSSSKASQTDTQSTCTPATSPEGEKRISPAGLSALQPYECYAAKESDLELAAGFFALAKVPRSKHSARLIKQLLRTIALLHSCQYDSKDINCVLAHAAVYHEEVSSHWVQLMDEDEHANVVGLLIFLAHCHVIDEACPLSSWHKCLFRRYCSVKRLNKALMQLMTMRKYVLRVSDDVLQARIKVLEAHIQREDSFG
eukprot:CAMPEP_0197657696 /NCGR_PEP_ID=MMETSP1338-20131121/44791_1 /TAXON_ID=43686 ORGANISM="Pelagodinium beii, Strain RCC1491" /NCGR_SAMPLE_ID=MMETSP1338 /ASSEMBLY_ACC=CAM_ASM_000754 /LENGTH=224 /DNA_ID=CAMNT_0043234129 /DNA_START=56 /DNA_END=727 /DNA_ORIENTATION=+